MDDPRFYVSSITGYALGSGSTQATSYCVLDSAHCHREVFSAYASEKSGLTTAVRLAACEREAARRNALDTAGCAA